MDVMLKVTFCVYIAGIIAYVLREIRRVNPLRWVAFGVFTGAFLLNTYLVLTIWHAANHAPVYKYESLVFFAWTIALFYLIMELVTISSVWLHESSLGILGALQCVLSASMLFKAINTDSTIIRELPPALQSNWLVVHLITNLISCAALSISFSAAIIYLIYRVIYRGRTQEIVLSGTNSKLMKDITFDKLVYISVTIGFLFLTVGIITGSIWAKGAWGTYWGWDPKETWSLISWLVYLAYLLLLMILSKTKIKKTFAPILLSIVLLVAFPIVLFTFIFRNSF